MTTDLYELYRRKPPMGNIWVRYRTGLGCRDWRTLSLKTAHMPTAVAMVKQMDLAKIVHAKLAGITQGKVLRQLCKHGNMTVEMAANEWMEWNKNRGVRESTLYKHRQALLAMMSHRQCGRLKICQLKPEHLAEFLNRPTVKLTTLRTQQSVLQVWTRWLHAKSYIDADIGIDAQINTARLRFPQKCPKPKTVFTPDEIKKLLDHLRPERGFWYYAVPLASRYGFRLGDMCCLEKGSIGDAFVIYTMKVNRREQREVAPDLMAELREVARRSECFLWPEKQAVYVKPSMRNVISSEFITLCRKLGIHGKTFHSLRRTVATSIFKAEGIAGVQRELGHSNPSTSRLYVVDQADAPASQGGESVGPAPQDVVGSQTPCQGTPRSPVPEPPPCGNEPSSVHAA